MFDLMGVGYQKLSQMFSFFLPKGWDNWKRLSLVTFTSVYDSSFSLVR